MAFYLLLGKAPSGESAKTKNQSKVRRNRMRKIFKHGGLLAVLVVLTGALPAWAAGGGGGAVDLVVVADTRVLHNSFIRYIADTYNTNAWLFATWATVLTAAFGAFLGFFMDFLMKRTGIDLKSRKIVEH
jgi:hypothetical protein